MKKFAKGYGDEVNDFKSAIKTHWLQGCLSDVLGLLSQMFGTHYKVDNLDNVIFHRGQ